MKPAADAALGDEGPLLFGLDGSREVAEQAAGVPGVTPGTHDDLIVYLGARLA